MFIHIQSQSDLYMCTYDSDIYVSFSLYCLHHVCSGSYRHRQCCYLCQAISHTVEEDESQSLIYTHYGRDAEYRQVQLGCK